MEEICSIKLFESDLESMLSQVILYETTLRGVPEKTIQGRPIFLFKEVLRN